jgi:hypothetical protein
VKNAAMRLFFGGLLGLTLLGVLSLSAAPASNEPKAKPLQVTYFFLPG